MVRDRVNEIKRREPWRPLSPSILAECLDRYIEFPGHASFMIVAQRASDAAKRDIPATVHVDGSLRPHSVFADLQPHYHALISAFKERTGVPAVLNTSFNVQEPVVMNPHDAVVTFQKSGLDFLAIGPFLVTQNHGDRA